MKSNVCGMLAASLLWWTAASTSAQDFQIDWHTVDGGGTMFTAGDGLELSGTVGQPDAGRMSGGGFDLDGGFWSGARGPLGDLNCDGSIDAFDIDPFVLALTDPMTYETAWPDCDIAAADVNGDGAVNAFDIDAFVALLTGG